MCCTAIKLEDVGRTVEQKAIRIELVHHGEALHKEIQGLLPNIPICMCKTLGQLKMLLWCVDDVQDDALPIQKKPWLQNHLVSTKVRWRDGINMN